MVEENKSVFARVFESITRFFGTTLPNAFPSWFGSKKDNPAKGDAYKVVEVAENQPSDRAATDPVAIARSDNPSDRAATDPVAIARSDNPSDRAAADPVAIVGSDNPSDRAAADTVAIVGSDNPSDRAAAGDASKPSTQVSQPSAAPADTRGRYGGRAFTGDWS